MTYLAIDPGETSGWAWFDENGICRSPNPGVITAGFGQIRGQELLTYWLEELPVPPKVLIYEEYKILGEAQIHFGKEVPTIQNIGIIKSYAFRNDIELVKQSTDKKRLGYGWAQIKKAGNHSDSHRRDAYAHGFFYLVTHQIVTVTRRPPE